jgi:putative pyruvate formate lyase activating enzyme
LAEELTPDTFVNMMAQYHPAHKVTGGNFPEINRPVTREEMRKAYVDAKEAGIWRFDHRRPGWRFL